MLDIVLNNIKRLAYTKIFEIFRDSQYTKHKSIFILLCKAIIEIGREEIDSLQTFSSVFH